MGLISDTIGKAIDTAGKLIPDADKRLELENQLMAASMAAATAEAESADPWTSRARPSIMYVIYVLILFGIPMGILSAFDPDRAQAIAAGFKAWLGAIPDSLWAVFATCFSVYSVGRTFEKFKGVAR